MTRAEVISRLLANGNAPDLATQYADAYLEYRQATANIEKNGTVCADPRTGKPMENPFLKVRDKALKKMRGRGLCRVNSDGLWQ